MDAVRYGKTQTERDVEETEVARRIVHELVSEIRISQRQLLLIIHGLALNMESNEDMRRVTGLVRELRSDLFLIDRTPAEEDDRGSSDS